MRARIWSRSAAVSFCLSTSFASCWPIVVAPALGDVALRVRQRDREAVRRRQLRDAAAHLAGADDADAGDAV